MCVVFASMFTGKAVARKAIRMTPILAFLGTPPSQIIGARVIRNLDRRMVVKQFPALGPYSSYKQSADRYASSKRAYHVRGRLVYAHERSVALRAERELQYKRIDGAVSKGIVGTATRRIAELSAQLLALGRKVQAWQNELRELT